MPEYQSSEEIARAHASDVFTKSQEKAQTGDINEKQKIKKVLDKYINDHKDSTKIRDEAKKNDRSADYQLDLSADIVLILEKIKSDLR